MRIWPIGVSSSNLKVFWPLWDAALLRRYGRAPTASERVLVAALAAELSQRAVVSEVRCKALCASPDLHLVLDRAFEQGVEVGIHLVDRLDRSEPPELDLHWPSEELPEESRTVYVDRVMREPYPEPGEFIDILY